MEVRRTTLGRARLARMRTGAALLVALGLVIGSSIFLPASATLPAGGVVFAAEGVPSPLYFARLYIDGTRPTLPKPAVLADSHLYAPARAAFENLGAGVHWDGTKVIIKTYDEVGRTTTMNLWLGRDSADVNGETVPLEAPPFIWDGTVMVPVKFVADMMGLTSTWDQERRSLYLTRGAGTGGAGTGGTGSAGGAAGTGGTGGDGSTISAALVPPQITLAFAGDTLLGSRIGTLIAANGVDYPWGGVAPVLSKADLAMVNLECSVSTRGSPMPNKQYTFRAAPESLAGLRNAGVDVVTLANNHALDFGEEAFLDTISYLDQYGVYHVGAGANSAEAIKPVILDIRGFKVGYLGVTAIYPVGGWIATASHPGMAASHNQATTMKAVSDLAKQVDYVVVAIHWGVERARLANDYQKTYGRALVDAGADLVIGHHPHILEGMQVYNGKLIAYSLGNFVFTYSMDPCMDTGILLVTLDAQGIAAAQFLPGSTGRQGHPILFDEGADHDRILADLRKYSEAWGTEFDPTGYILLP